MNLTPYSVLQVVLCDLDLQENLSIVLIEEKISRDGFGDRLNLFLLSHEHVGHFDACFESIFLWLCTLCVFCQHPPLFTGSYFSAQKLHLFMVLRAY